MKYITCLLLMVFLSSCSTDGLKNDAPLTQAPITKLIEHCEVCPEEETQVLCPLKEFKQGLFGCIGYYELLLKATEELVYCEEIGHLDKVELQNKLDVWYRNPWIWLGVSLAVGAVGFGIGAGLSFSK
jgi:hypothetical protein